MQADFQQRLTSLLSSPACAGAASGFLIGVFLQPLEIIKVCLIVNPTKLAVLNTANFAESFVLSARVIYQLEGLKGFWRGLTPALMRIGTANSVYFHFLELFSKPVASFQFNQRINDFVTSSSARIISTLMINPLTMLKTRMELPGDQFNYKGVYDGVSKVYKKEGFKAFFKGAGACMFRDVPFAGLYYTLLNYSKEHLSKFGVQASANTIVSGMVAGLIATTATHPFELIRTHLQVSSNEGPAGAQKGIFRGLYEIQKSEGTLGLFKGLQARLMRKPLSNALTFTFFEIFSKNNSKKEKKFI